MFFNKNRDRVIERNQLWYVETESGYEGPFNHFSDAREFLRLKQKADSARVEFAGLEDILYKT